MGEMLQEYAIILALSAYVSNYGDSVTLGDFAFTPFGIRGYNPI
jgi:hypothetical protein